MGCFAGFLDDFAELTAKKCRTGWVPAAGLVNEPGAVPFKLSPVAEPLPNKIIAAHSSK